MSAKAKNKLTPQQRKATLNRVLHKIRPYSAFVVCSLLVAAVSVAAQLYIPILCGDAIDKMLGKGNVDLAGVLRIAVSILVVAAVAALAQWLLSVCNNRITFSVSRDLRNEALRKIQTLPLSYLDSHPSGDIVSRMVADVDTFADGLLMGFTQLFSGILTIFWHPAVHAAGKRAHHAGGGVHHPAEPCGGGLSGKAQLRLLPEPEHRARQTDRAGQRDDRGSEGGAGLWPRSRKPCRL